MNTIIIIILTIIFVLALVLTLKRFNHGSGCCGEHASSEKIIKPTRPPSGEDVQNVTIRIGGMTCDNCARKVANELNRVPGVRAQVSISSKIAKIEADSSVTDQQLRSAIRTAGFVPLTD